MDAVEFLKARSRMCNDNVCEGDCPLFYCCNDRIDDNMVKLVSIVEQWAKAHPAKTRQSEFLKQCPDAEISDDGLPSIAPCQLDVRWIHGESPEDCESRGVFGKCRCDFWLKEIK